MKQEIIIKGTRAVVISIQENTVLANLYVNASNGIMDATITTQRWQGKTVAGAKRWADKVL